MQSDTSDPQEQSRTERVTLAVTPYEKGAIRALAAFKGESESHLLRSMTLAEIAADFERVREAAGAAMAGAQAGGGG